MRDSTVKKLLTTIKDAGCAAPAISGTPCCDYMPPGTQHELGHAVDGCRGKLGNCPEIVCSEFKAYFTADCNAYPKEADRINCAIRRMQIGEQAKASQSGDEACNTRAQLFSLEDAKECLSK
jgi:hypothetical protein